MGRRKSTSLHLDEQVYEEIKEYVRESHEFNSISAYVDYLFKKDVHDNPLVTDSNLEKIKKNLSSTQRNTMILLQILTNLASKEQVIAKDIYEEIYQYKSAVEIIDEYFNEKKMNRFIRKDKGIEEIKPKFTIDPYDF